MDVIFQDTWLLALAIRNTPGVVVDKQLYQHCLKQIEQVQEKLQQAGATEAVCEEIKFAHCVFLDEAVMTQKDVDVSFWWHESPIQSRLLMHLRGGEYFYEHIKKLLREPAPSVAIMACYHRMLTLGYQGKHIPDGGEDNEERQSLLNQLRERLPGARDKADTPVFIRSHRPDIRLWRRRPWVLQLAGLLVTVAVSCAMSAHLHWLLRLWFTRR
ncbi:hypothetical protein NG99_16855 [Erwinia typographi]|uniref:Type IV / VI secretion system DotU domain-containing protein n=2 Tax=Erwinia typographi TaxID=371042 RepID=A0A0A4A095_9GAMM|nr:hypothetical protein NG99_16855 [Erwinia typographi]